MRVGRHPALLAPGQDLLQLDFDLLRLGRDLDDFPHRPDLEALGDFDIDLPQRQLDPRFTVDVGAGVGTGRIIPVQDVGEVDAVVLEPGRVKDTMAVDRRQVFASLAVDMQLHRHRMPPAALDHAQHDRLLGRRDRKGSAVGYHAAGSSAFHLGYRDDPAAVCVEEVETGLWMRGVLDQNFAVRQLRKLVVVAVLPGVVRVDQARRRGDHLSEIELDLFQQPILVQLRSEGLPLGQGQTGLAPRPPAQRDLANVPGGDRRDQDRAGERLEAKADDRFLGIRVLPGPQPVHPRAVICGRDARLTPAP